jgi:hypothetical protein
MLEMIIGFDFFFHEVVDLGGGGPFVCLSYGTVEELQMSRIALNV